MAQEIIPSSSPALEEVKEQFAQWRQNRKGRESIPDELWQAAVRLTKEHSLNKIVKELNLSYSGFKERVVKAQKNDSPFVEFHLPTPANGATHWVLETIPVNEFHTDLPPVSLEKSPGGNISVIFS
jgi:hypothetical protein